MKIYLVSLFAVAACTNSDGDSKTESEPPTATDIAYDNAASGLTSTNVQDALDDVFAMAQAQQEQAATSVITCRFASANLTIPSLSGSLTIDKAIFPHAFTANECGGKLPDANYVGAVSRMNVCNEILGVAVMNSGEPDGPGVQIHTWGNCTGPAQIVAVYFKAN